MLGMPRDLNNGSSKASRACTTRGMTPMAESLYKIIELVGSSEKSFEDAISNAIETASKTLRDLRVAEIEKLDVRIENNKIATYRAKIKLSFKFERE